jgi:hypothetical protein
LNINVYLFGEGAGGPARFSMSMEKRAGNWFQSGGAGITLNDLWSDSGIQWISGRLIKSYQG